MKTLLLILLISSAYSNGLIDELKIGDSIKVKQSLISSSFRNLRKEKRNFLVRFVENSPYLLKCSVYIRVQYFDSEDNIWLNGVDVISKNTPMRISGIDFEGFADFKKENKSIARHQVSIYAFNSNQDETGSMEYINITCSRDFMASKRFRHREIKIDEVQRALKNEIEFIQQ